jgi:type I restriction enzyme S subunit
LVAWSASLGAYIWKRGDAWLNQHIFRVEPYDITDNQFLYYAITQSINELYQKAHGMGMVHVTKGTFEAHEVPLPPLNEQKRIAEKLDTLLANVDAIKKRLDNAPTILKRFRQSVLAAATSGKLTEEWREAKGVVCLWGNLPLQSFIQNLQQGWSPKCESYPAGPNEWGVIKTSSVQSILFIASENKCLPSSLLPRQKLTLRKGDILITRAGPRVRCGVTCYVDKDVNNLMICDKVYRVRVTDSIDAKYLVYTLNSPAYLDEIEEMKTGISDSGLNLTQKKFISMKIPVPSKIEQQEIVSRVESLFALADALEAKIEVASNRVDKLTQSILAKAFRGELVPQDPTDEPAEKLLKRIKNEN